MSNINVLLPLVTFSIFATSSQAKFGKEHNTSIRSWENSGKVICYKTIDENQKLIESGLFYMDTNDRLIDAHFANSGFQRNLQNTSCDNFKNAKNSNQLYTVTIHKNSQHRNVDINVQLMKVRHERPELFKVATVVYTKNKIN